MKTRIYRIAAILLALCIVMVSLPAATAALDPGPAQPGSHFPDEVKTGIENPQQDDLRKKERQSQIASTVTSQPESTGGPDVFGYTWDDTVTFNWIDAKSSGVNSGLSGDDKFSGPVNIGFNFPFYENTYSQLYFSTNGLLTFGEGSGEYWNQSVPNTNAPDNFIAPLWGDLCVDCSGYNSGQVYYYLGGSAPNRYFVVEWFEVSELGENDLLTFEAILHEDGDIVLQYLSLGSSPWVTIGTEDDAGIDGLEYNFGAWGSLSNLAVQITRSGAIARVKAWPAHQSRFSGAAGLSYPMHIRNTGEVGDDTYDLFVTSGWTVELYEMDGTTLLTDTDSDGTVDTGTLSEGETKSILVKVIKPGGSTVGDWNQATVTSKSSLDTNKSMVSTFRTAVPAQYAQVFTDQADKAMNIYLTQTEAQADIKTTQDGIDGGDMSVAEMPGGFVYFWNRYISDGSFSTIRLEYVLLDHYGSVVQPLQILSDNTGSTVSIYDYDPAVAVAPDGRIGVAWYRYRYDSSNNSSNFNIYYSILNANGDIVVAPTNLTNNDQWFVNWGEAGELTLAYPTMAATQDNRFTIGWQKKNFSTEYITDIFFTIRDTAGGVVKPVSPLTEDFPGSGEGYQTPNISPLDNNRTIVNWRQESNMQITYQILDSLGNTVKSAASTGATGWEPDAAQLSGGNILIGCRSSIKFVVLDQDYNPIAGPTTISDPYNTIGERGLSVTADALNHGILTWMDENSQTLSYALIGENGDVITDPMVFLSSPHADGSTATNWGGSYGSTTYSWTAPAGVDGIAEFPKTPTSGPEGGEVPILISYANHGTKTGTNATLTLTLDSSLTYLGDTSGITPSIIGDSITWDVPDMHFLDQREFTVSVQVPASAYGTAYPVSISLSTDGPEANPGDNSANTQVLVFHQLYLPMTLSE